MPTFIDSFARARMSAPQTLFDSKQLHDKAPLWWDESIVNGSGNAASTHSTADAATTMHVESGDTIIRQTKQCWNYQPGKSQLVVFTGVLGAGGAGVFVGIGQFTATDGMFFALRGTTLSVEIRKGGNDTKVEQAGWNGDKLDGNGKSRITFDATKLHVFYISYEWLGGGPVEFGMFLLGMPVRIHTFAHLNDITVAYTATPNLPMRYEISSTSATAELVHQCATVISEGGAQALGIDYAISTRGAHVDANVADTIYAVVGIRLKSTHIDATVDVLRVHMIDEGAKAFEWLLLLNPSVAGTFAYADVANTALQRALGALANSITADSEDLVLASGWGVAGRGGTEAITEIVSAIRLGAKIDGTVDEIVLAVRPLAVNEDIQGTVEVKELV